jgi:DNA-binding NtrC family response regulator
MEEFTKSLDQIVETFERNIIEKALKETHGNQTKAAQLLGISKRKIQYKVNMYGIDYRSIKEEYGTGRHVLNSWHHFYRLNKDDGLLLP